MNKRRQPQRLPPPIMHGADPIEATVVLQEYPDAAGTLLWQSVRAVLLWAEFPAGQRSGIFASGAFAERIERIEALGEASPWQTPLRVLATVLRGRARAGTIAAACREISEGASAEGRFGTALEFMQAAAVALPGDARLAHDVARLARSRTDYVRAETWYRQAIARARRSKQWHDFSLSYIGLGTVFMRRGSFPHARKALIRGLRAAKRFSLHPLVAAAYHELMVLAIQRERAPEVARYARAAVESYGPAHERLPALAFDYGIFLLSRGHSAEALRTFQGVPQSFGRPVDRLARAAAIVQAAGGVGEYGVYEEGWRDAEALLRDPAAAPGAATALQAMARGALLIGERERAEISAHRVQQLAAERGEAALEFAAAELLEEIRRPEPAAEIAVSQESALHLSTVVDELRAALAPVGA